MCVCQMVKRVDTCTAYLYTRHQFGWGLEDYSFLVLLLVLSGSVGTSLVLPVLSLYLHVDDCVLGIMGTLSWVDFHLVMGLAQREWLLYLAVAFAVLKDCTNVTIRSILSKLSQKNSCSLFSLLACMEALVPLVATPLTDWVYTLHSFNKGFPRGCFYADCWSLVWQYHGLFHTVLAEGFSYTKLILLLMFLGSAL